MLLRVFIGSLIVLLGTLAHAENTLDPGNPIQAEIDKLSLTEKDCSFKTMKPLLTRIAKIQDNVTRVQLRKSLNQHKQACFKKNLINNN